MAAREIDEAEYVAQRQLATLFNTMLQHPDARKLVQKATKIVNPQAAIPEIDAKEEVMTEVEKVRADLLALREERDTEKAQREADKKTADFADSWGKQKNKLLRGGYTDEGVTAVEKLAEERGIPDLEAAAALFEKLNPPPDPAQPRGSGNWDLFEGAQDTDDDERKRLLANPDDTGALGGLINKALADVRGSNRR